MRKTRNILLIVSLIVATTGAVLAIVASNGIMFIGLMLIGAGFVIGVVALRHDLHQMADAEFEDELIEMRKKWK